MRAPGSAVRARDILATIALSAPALNQLTASAQRLDVDREVEHDGGHLES